VTLCHRLNMLAFPPGRARSGPWMTDPPHILIVDDGPRIRNMLRRYLVEEGFKVSDAGDGAGTRAVLAREVMVRSSGYVFAAAAVGITLPSANVRSPGSYDE
jgi:hypothetical protein